MRGNSQQPPVAGEQPDLENPSMKRARSEPLRMSQASARSQRPPLHRHRDHQ
jgi:hypothetical protein